jgi:hypothetical protein
VQASRPSTNNWQGKLLKIMEPCEVEAKKMEILLTCFQLQRLTSLTSAANTPLPKDNLKTVFTESPILVKSYPHG